MALDDREEALHQGGEVRDLGSVSSGAVMIGESLQHCREQDGWHLDGGVEAMTDPKK
jgi:hypothetical protein